MSQGTSTPTPYASAVPSMHPHEMCQGCSCPWLSAPVIPTVPDTWLTFAIPLSICEDPPGSIKPQLLQEPLSSPCPFQASRHHCHRHTQHTPCFPLGWLLWSTGPTWTHGWCSQGATWVQGTAPSTTLSSRKGLVSLCCHSPRYCHSALATSSSLSSFWLPRSSVPLFLSSVSLVLCPFPLFAVHFLLWLVLSDAWSMTLSCCAV